MVIYKAIHMAIKAHENQVRKLDNDMYVAHPLEVGITLARHNMPEEVIVAGILHDTVEDTTLSLEDIEAEFGHLVRTYVDYCSEKNKCDSWKNRKIEYLNRLIDAPIDVMYIVCADKLTNIKSIARHYERLGHIIWDKFNAGFIDQKWYYLAILDILHPIHAHPLYIELEQTVKLVFKD